MSNEQKSVIELKELRIGNYLLYKGEIVHVTTISLDVDDELEDTIGFCKHGQIHNETSDWNRALYNDLERIPLTVDWLKRMGATYPYKDESNICQIGSELFKLENGEMCLWEADHGVIAAGTRFKYVHQLQNLFLALTGEELKLKDQ